MSETINDLNAALAAANTKYAQQSAAVSDLAARIATARAGVESCSARFKAASAGVAAGDTEAMELAAAAARDEEANKVVLRTLESAFQVATAARDALKPDISKAETRLRLFNRDILCEERLKVSQEIVNVSLELDRLIIRWESLGQQICYGDPRMNNSGIGNYKRLLSATPSALVRLLKAAGYFIGSLPHGGFLQMERTELFPPGYRRWNGELISYPELKPAPPPPAPDPTPLSHRAWTPTDEQMRGSSPGTQIGVLRSL